MSTNLIIPKGSLPTFSLNCKLTKEKAKKVAALINSINEFNCEFASEAYIQIMEGKTKKYHEKDALRDFNAYAHFHKIEEICDSAKRAEREVNATCEEEISLDDVRTVVEQMVDNSDVEADVFKRVDAQYYISQFLEIREKLYFKKGIDLYRLLSVALTGDYQATVKLRVVVYECDLTDFLKEFFAVPRYWAEVCKILR